jgi:predicted MarR family transcription regulator
MKVEKELAEAGLYRQSHLSREDETAFIEFEFALHHIVEAFGRWSSELHAHVSGQAMAVQDVSLLQIVRMKDTPKSAAEIGKYLNRTDSANVVYGLRKLEKGGLIEKTPGPPRETTYQVTPAGREITDLYAAKRRELLLSLIDRMSGSGEIFTEANQTLWLMSGLYEQAARTVSVMSCLSDTPDAPVVKLDKTRKAG